MGAAAGVIGPATSLLSMGIGMIGQSEQNQATAAADEYKSQIDFENATIDTQNANLAVFYGNQAEFAQGLQGAAQMGQIKSIEGASGVDMSSPSSVAVRSGAAELNRYAEIMDEEKGLGQAYQYQVKSWQDQTQGLLDSQAAAYAASAFP
jgi:hypothetical protein